MVPHKLTTSDQSTYHDQEAVTGGLNGQQEILLPPHSYGIATTKSRNALFAPTHFVALSYYTAQ